MKLMNNSLIGHRVIRFTGYDQMIQYGNFQKLSCLHQFVGQVNISLTWLKISGRMVNFEGKNYFGIRLGKTNSCLREH
jgi:hypothetical protein